MANFNFNKVILGGRLTADPELRQTPQGVSVVSFSIAISRKYNKNNEQQTADFINCVAWRSTAEFICKYFRRGSSICVTGGLQTRSWTDSKTNEKRYATDVVVDEANFVDSKGGEGSAERYTTPIQNGSENAQNFDSATYTELADDDSLPF